MEKVYLFDNEDVLGFLVYGKVYADYDNIDSTTPDLSIDNFSVNSVGVEVKQVQVLNPALLRRIVEIINQQPFKI